MGLSQAGWRFERGHARISPGAIALPPICQRSSELGQGNIKMFADDTKLWARICSVEDSVVLQEDLRRLKVWSDEWLLHFNPEKCKVMHIGHTYDKCKKLVSLKHGVRAINQT